jgi:hypothetical protein
MGSIMRSRLVVRIGIFAAVVAYFPVKIYWLAHYQPRFWIRIAVSAMFWGALLVVGVLSERSARSRPM